MPHSAPARVRLADVLLKHGESYLQSKEDQLSPQQWSAFRSIIQCRTAALGGHTHACTACGKRHHIYHSCNHRLCPQCGGAEAKQWLAKQEARLLDVPYFMITFTVPGTLRRFCQSDEAFWYEALFACSSKVLMTMAKERKQLAGDAAFVGVLHTWARDLTYHPHIHYIMPGGVLHTDEQGKQSWRGTKQHAGKDYLCPVKELSIAMRIAMQEHVRETNPEAYARVPRQVWRQAWVTHIQPAGNARHTLKYLARYVTKSAIGKERILSDDARGITFSYTPHGETRARTMTLSPHAFIDRVLQHALPKGFKRVRYYGWLHPAAKKRLHRVQNLTGTRLDMSAPSPGAAASEANALQNKCKQCGGSEFRVVEKLKPKRFFRLSAATLRPKRIEISRPGASRNDSAAGRARAPPPEKVGQTSQA